MSNIFDDVITFRTLNDIQYSMRNTGNNYIFTSSFKAAFMLHLKIETYKNVRTDY